MPASEPVPFRRALSYFIAGLIHAAAMALAFPPVDLWGFAFVAPVPLIWAGWRRGRDLAERGRSSGLGRGPWMVSLGVLPLHVYEHHWLIDVTALGYPFMAIVMSLFYGLFVWVVSLIVARRPMVSIAWVGAAAWAGIEVFRGEVTFSGYPWLLVAHPLAGVSMAACTAALLGTYFTSFLVAMVGGVAVEVGLCRRVGVATMGAAVFVVLAIAAGSVMRPVHRGPTVRVGVVQSNIPQSNKLDWKFEDRLRDFGMFAVLTRQAAAQADVVVWPETMFPGMSLSASAVAEERRAGLEFRVSPEVDARGTIASTEFHDLLMRLSADIGTPMLVGALSMEGFRIGSDARGDPTFDFDKRLNSVFAVEKGRVDPTPYSKMELTPFGEAMPGIQRWPWLQRQLLSLGAGGMSFDLTPGSGPRGFDFGEATYVTPICFEATKPGLCRRLVLAAKGRPTVMVNLTNDGWFGAFRGGRMQHLQIARWRCIELGVPMVRAANTGVSAALDGDGRVVAAGIDGRPGAWNEAGVLTATVRPSPAQTMYARVGDVFGWGALWVTVAGWLWALASSGSSKKEPIT